VLLENHKMAMHMPACQHSRLSPPNRHTPSNFCSTGQLIISPVPLVLCSVLFSFIGRDFFNALSSKDQEKFAEMLIKWIGGICLAVPVYTLR
jgi:hypothetical protein